MTEENNENIIQDRDLSSLKGTEKIRLFPSVNLGSDGIRGVQQTLFEVITNGIDRWKLGYGDKVLITRHDDNSFTIQDFADGLPTSWNENEQAYNWDLALNTLYGGDCYVQSENLTGKLGNFGLGLTSTMWSSEWMQVIVYKNGLKNTLKFKDGRPIDKETGEFIKEDNDYHLSKEEGERVLLVEPSDLEGLNGTTISYKPDLRVFTSINVPSEWIEDKLRKQAMVNNGLNLIFKDELNNESFKYNYENIAEYIKNISKDNNISDVIEFKNDAEGQDSDTKPMYKMDYNIAFTFNNDIQLQEYYHNSSELTELNLNVTTKAVKQGLTNAIHKYIESNNMYTKGEKIKFEDIEDSLICILSSRSTKTSYANQTKLSIDNAFIKKFITQDLEDKLNIYLTENQFEAQKISNQILVNKRANDKASKSKLDLKKKLSEKISIINKIPNLYESESKDRDKNILCICEGKSALSSLIVGKRDIHAIFPLRGKILNCLKASPEQIFSSDVIRNLILALGCGVEFKSKKNKDLSVFNIDNMRYSKIYIFVDADVDGIGSIMPLLLTMFYTLTPTLVKQNRICICESPKYEIDFGDEEYFAVNDEDLQQIKTKLDYENNKNKIKIHYIKGLSELSSNAMSMCLSEDYKNIKVITLEDIEKSTKTIELFMSTEVKPRKEYILENFDKIGGNLE